MNTPRDTLRLAIDHENPTPLPPPRLDQEPTPDEYTALADLFLSEPKANAQPAEAPSPKTPDESKTDRIEALIVGHLPVMGSAWVRQHARQTARDLGRPVALLRLSAGHAALDVFGDTSGIENMVPAADLDAGIRTANHLDPHWMIRTDAVAETTLAGARGIDRRTLLTGADEAAIVAAYRAIKSLLPADPEDLPGSDIGVVIMGADHPDAEAAGRRIGRASEAFLGSKIEVTVGSDQIQTGPATTVFRGETALELTGAIELAASGASMFKLTGAPAPAAPSKPRVSPRPAPRTSSLEPTLDLPSHPHSSPTRSTPAHSNSARSNSTRPAPTLERHASPAAIVPAASEDGRLPGMRVLAADCPAAHGVQVAVDQQRSPHLIAEAHDKATAEAAAASLQAALSWFRAHESLLVSLSGQRFTGTVTPHLVISGDPAEIRHLLDAEIVVHLSVPPAKDETLLTLSDPTQKTDAS